MGVNLKSACHVHKVQVFHFRSEEHYTLMPFYYKHRDCLRDTYYGGVETLEDQDQEKWWMAEYPDGYKTDIEVQFKHPHYDDPENRKWYGADGAVTDLQPSDPNTDTNVTSEAH